jgi:hypothetical protein
MRRQDGHRDVEEQAGETAERPAPAPALSPGSLAWASAVGNQAVARLASTQSVARAPVSDEEEESLEAEDAGGEPAPASEEAGPAEHEPEEPEGEEEEELSP